MSIPASVDIGTNTEWITLLHTSIEQTGSEMLKTSAVSAWFAGHILSILVIGESLSISAIGY